MEINEKFETIKVYTDGGCIGNPGKGAWAYVLLLPGNEIRGSGGVSATTNNQMELSAVIEALEELQTLGTKPGQGVIHTDSQYVKNGITTWIYNWEKNGWRTANKEPVKNKEFWIRLKALSDVMKPSWTWVKGHAGNPMNELCDQLVRETMDKIS